jgi:hypothetical protein
VIKSPWLFEFVDALLERKDITIDAVILPMRDIVEAASSRVILEMRRRYGDDFPEDVCQWETWGLTAGGVVFSLNPIDQARILALGFHQTVFALVKNQIPIVFLDFVRMIEDANYLWEAMAPVIGKRVDRDTAIDAHVRTADARKVRVSRENLEEESAEGSGADCEPPPFAAIRHDSPTRLDRAALLREMQSRHAAAQQVVAQQREAIHSLEAELRATQAQLLTARFELQATRAGLNPSAHLRSPRKRM